MNDKRELIQAEAHEELIKHKRCSAGISMRLGKTLIGLKYLDYFEQFNHLRILIAYPKLSIEKSWREDIEKFRFNHLDITYTTYVSLSKQDLNYDILVLDENHSLTESCEEWLSVFKGRILGLTGTPPKNKGSVKYRLVNTYCPVVYTYVVNDAVSDKILSDYLITVHTIPMSAENNIPVKFKNRTGFMTSEVKNYKYWSDLIAGLDAEIKEKYEEMAKIEPAINDNSSDPSTIAIRKITASIGRLFKQKQMKAIMRMNSMKNFKSKENYAKQLINSFGDDFNKLLIFANTTDQADSMSVNSHHSKNKESAGNLEAFQSGEINMLSCVAQISEGISIHGLDTIVMLHAFGNERKAMQRLARALLPEDGKVAGIHIIASENTVDLDKWVPEALSDLDPEKIIYISGQEYFKSLNAA